MNFVFYLKKNTLGTIKYPSIFFGVHYNKSYKNNNVLAVNYLLS